MPVQKRTQSGACGSGAVDESKKIWVSGVNVGISSWSSIVEEVRGLGLKDEQKIAEELLKRVKQNDYVPTSNEKEYRKALLEEFRKAP